MVIFRLRNRGLLRLVIVAGCASAAIAFDNIDDVTPADERAAFVASYKEAAGFSMKALNTSPPIIAAGTRVMS